LYNNCREQIVLAGHANTVKNQASSRGFTTELKCWGLCQNRSAPGLESSHQPPPTRAPNPNPTLKHVLGLQHCTNKYVGTHTRSPYKVHGGVTRTERVHKGKNGSDTRRKRTRFRHEQTRLSSKQTTKQAGRFKSPPRRHRTNAGSGCA